MSTMNRVKNDYSEFTIEAAVETVVSSAFNDASGQIESLEAAVGKLTDLVGALVARLPRDDVVEILNHHDWRTWETA